MSYSKERYANDPVYRAKIKATWKASAKANRPKINAWARHRLATDPKVAEAARRTWLRRQYGITLEDYNAMVARQNGLCALCQRRPVERLCVDHCHDTLMLRLLLCRTCNGGLGNFHHDPDLMRAGADYVEIGGSSTHGRGRNAKRIPIKTFKAKKKRAITTKENAK